MSKYVILTVALTLLTGLVFFFWPNLDLDVARRFYTPESGFIGITTWGRIGRSIGADVPFIVPGVMLIAYIFKRRGWNVPFAPTGKSVAFLVLSFALSTGVLVNLVMKDHLHRPRPSHVTEFGGPWTYRAFYQFDGQCPRNCSFPSGEASAAFWLVAPASLMPAPYKPLAIGAALVFGAATSILRMAFGGHFLSDVLFGGLLTLLVVFGVHRWVFGRKSS
eukprot:gene9440-9520_t